MEVVNTEDVITKLLSTYQHDDKFKLENVMFIDSCYLTNLREWITKHSEPDCFTDKGPYKLRIMETVYDVNLVILPKGNWLHRQFYSIYWKNYQTVFIDLETFFRLKEVVEQENLENHIKSIQTWREINSQNKTIKIVTFRNNSNLIFNKLITTKVAISRALMYRAFPWFDPSQLPQFDKQSVNDEFFVGLITFLQCQRELCYDMKSEFTLSVIELCALKLAFCPEFGIESPACTALAHEIDGVIIDSLNRLTKDNSEGGYFRDNHFNLLQYTYDRDVDLCVEDVVCFYFIYYFQDWMESVTLPKTLLDRRNDARINLVKDHKFILSRMRKQEDVIFHIDGTDFSGMDFKLFSGFLGTGNVYEIILDTNYRWLNSANGQGSIFSNETEILFIGDNKFNFIEDCIGCFKLIDIVGVLNLIFVNPKIESFLIFKKLNVRSITFVDLTLTSSILSELIACEFDAETKIEFYNCIIVDDKQSWTLLNELNFSKAVIIEEEKTWQFVFDYIVNQMKDSNSNKYTFKKDLRVKTQNGRRIKLKHLKFTIDEFEARLKIRDRNTNETLDLFDLKNLILRSFWCPVDIEEEDSEEEYRVEEYSDEEGSSDESSGSIQSKRKLSLIDEFQPISKQNKLN